MHPSPAARTAPAQRWALWSSGERLRQASDWFTTTDVLGEELVPTRADWCTVHVRASVIAALRAGSNAALTDLGLLDAVDGEPLEMVTLRHRDGEREPLVRQWAADMPVRIGDSYGAGRVTATGITRYLPHVETSMLAAAASTQEQLAHFQRLNIASSIVVPLRTSTGALLGAMTLIREPDNGQPFTAQDVRAAEAFAHLAAEALDSSRLATITAQATRQQAGPAHRTATWQPADPGDPTNSTQGRSWARRTLAEVLTTPPRRDLYDDMDLILTELLSNAVRHGGGLRQAALSNTGKHLRLAASDNDPRTPTLRPTQTNRANGRGMHLIQAIAERWGVRRQHTETGKSVWADLRLTG
ncbi:ATP-binding protein [Actinoplanes xinjiangensis]|uniref:ATP-binding protein n=1 Tax=Actinoplanes xinjiangensis TaxID=512350 RepID=UPI0034241A84